MKKNIEKESLRNTKYRKVIYTVPNSMQLVLMSLKPREEIGLETHKDASQFIRVESGVGVAEISGEKYRLKSGDAILVPKNHKHNVRNTSYTQDMKLYTVYTPPTHKPDTVQTNKPEND